MARKLFDTGIFSVIDEASAIADTERMQALHKELTGKDFTS